MGSISTTKAKNSLEHFTGLYDHSYSHIKRVNPYKKVHLENSVSDVDMHKTVHQRSTVNINLVYYWPAVTIIYTATYRTSFYCCPCLMHNAPETLPPAAKKEDIVTKNILLCQRIFWIYRYSWMMLVKHHVVWIAINAYVK